MKRTEIELTDLQPNDESRVRGGIFPQRNVVFVPDGDAGVVFEPNDPTFAPRGWA